MVKPRCGALNTISIYTCTPYSCNNDESQNLPSPSLGKRLKFIIFFSTQLFSGIGDEWPEPPLCLIPAVHQGASARPARSDLSSRYYHQNLDGSDMSCLLVSTNGLQGCLGQAEKIESHNPLSYDLAGGGARVERYSSTNDSLVADFK